MSSSDGPVEYQFIWPPRHPVHPFSGLPLTAHDLVHLTAIQNCTREALKVTSLSARERSRLVNMCFPHRICSVERPLTVQLGMPGIVSRWQPQHVKLRLLHPLREGVTTVEPDIGIWGFAELHDRVVSYDSDIATRSIRVVAGLGVRWAPSNPTVRPSWPIELLIAFCPFIPLIRAIVEAREATTDTITSIIPFILLSHKEASVGTREWAPSCIQNMLMRIWEGKTTKPEVVNTYDS